MLATTAGVLFLGIFFATLIAQGSSAFRQTFLKLDIVITSYSIHYTKLYDW